MDGDNYIEFGWDTEVKSVSLWKLVDALVLLRAIYSIPGALWQNLDILITTYFRFNEVSLKSYVKLAVIIFLMWGSCKESKTIKISFNIYCLEAYTKFFVKAYTCTAIVSIWNS